MIAVSRRLGQGIAFVTNISPWVATIRICRRDGSREQTHLPQRSPDGQQLHLGLRGLEGETEVRAEAVGAHAGGGQAEFGEAAGDYRSQAIDRKVGAMINMRVRYKKLG